MKLIRSVRKSLLLLPPRDRRRLGLVALGQISTSLLDLLGVLLIGTVAALGISVVSGKAMAPSIGATLDLLQIPQVDATSVALALSAVAAILLILKSLTNVTLTRYALKFLAGRQADVSAQLTRTLLGQPLLQIQSRSSQQTVYALTTGVTFATLIILGQGVIAVAEISLLMTLTIGLLFVDLPLTLFTLGFFTGVAILLHRLLSGRAHQLGEQVSLAEIESYEAIQEALRAYREITVSHRRSHYAARIQQVRCNAATAQAEMQFVGLLPKYAFEMALVIGATVLAASQLFTKDAVAAISTIAIYLAAGTRVLPSILRLQGAVISVQSGSAQAQATYELYEDLGAPERSSVTEVGSPQDFNQGGFVGEISVRSVSLKYPGSRQMALQEISLEVSAGSSVALVGPSGSGKSSLADVLLGILDPHTGFVLVSGLSPSAAIRQWPGAIGYVPQDVAIVSGSIRRNVALGIEAHEVDDDLVWRALERAHLAEFLRLSRDGLDTVVGEAGVRLSGGQRQRIGIARALYSDPVLLVLDEATSALDAETELSISEMMRGLSGSVTTVTIAHRLATVRHSDLVIYLEAGRLVAQGSFQDVRRAVPNFDVQASLLGL